MKGQLLSNFSFPSQYFYQVRRRLLGNQPGPGRIFVTVQALPTIPTLSDQAQLSGHMERSNTKAIVRARVSVKAEPKTLKVIPKNLIAKKSTIQRVQRDSRSRFAVILRPARFLSILIFIISLIGISIFILPNIYFLMNSPQTVVQTPTNDGTPIGGKFTEGVKNRTVTHESTQPPVDPALPQGDWVIIPRIGVRTQLEETDDQQKALEKGIWRIPGYGQPGQVGSPLILASHRFGYTWWWQNNYWKYNSFHLLPQTEPGDIVEIISGQRKYSYEIYAGEEGKEITDYNADLILYTCKFLNSPVRYFRYARLIDYQKNTQASR
jgi:hypothetical protein